MKAHKEKTAKCHSCPSVAASGPMQITLTGKETNQIKVPHWMKEAFQVSRKGYQ